MGIKKLKRKIGVLLLDWGKYNQAFKNNEPSWIHLCNRIETLSLAPDGIGVQCNWRWSSELHAPKIFPFLGQRLMRRVFDDYPVVLDSNKNRSESQVRPDVSFIIGHRGKERLPHLLMTLRSISSQQDVELECIVVEQSKNSEIREALPQWVRYIHTKLADYNMPYCRSWAFNAGAKLARGNLLILHDNDMLVPKNYAKVLLEKAEKGFKVINLKRFIFYLSKNHTQRIFNEQSLNFDVAPDIVLQNLEAGGSLAVNRDAYFSIGGFDEEFIGWGGEDIEFWERAQTLNVYNYGYLPIIHLWHPPQPGKTPIKNTPGMQRFSRLTTIPIKKRIKSLSERNNLIRNFNLGNS
jgi:hypothetical protein